MTTGHDLERLETAIYEAAIVPEKWAAVLDGITSRTGARGGVFFGISTVTQSWVASDGLRDDMKEFVSAGWAANNTRMAIGLRKGLHLIPRFVTEADYYAPGELEREAIYNEFFYRKGLGYSAGTSPSCPMTTCSASASNAVLPRADHSRRNPSASSIASGRI